MRGFHKMNLNGFSQPAIQWKQPDKAHDIEKHAMLITSTLGQKRDGVAYPYQAYWDKLIEGGKPMACGWLTDRFGLCWQIVPRNIGELISHPKAMQAMMGMIKMDLPALEAAAREN